MSETLPVTYWRKCSSCKNPIGFATRYYICSVSTCNGLRTGYVFCSVACFERHLPGARHKDAAAMEEVSPSKANSATPPSGQRTIIRTTPTISNSSPSTPKEVLVIASRLKEYITAKSDCSTSASVMDVLSDHLRTITDRAIANARSEGRKTVMDRDFSFLKSAKN
jgi:hypothetical protein